MWSGAPTGEQPAAAAAAACAVILWFEQLPRDWCIVMSPASLLQSLKLPTDMHAPQSHRYSYREPGLVFIVGTAHVSAKSADDVARVIDAVTPDAVVVELCRSRSALLVAPGGEAAGGQQQQQEQRQQQQQEEQPAAVAGREAAADGSYEEQQAAAAAAAAARAASGAAASTSPSSGANPLGLSGAGSFGEAMVRTLAQGGQSGLVLRLLLAGQAKRAAARLGVTAGAEFEAAAAAAERAGAQLVLGDRPVEISLQRAWGALSWRRRAALLRELVAASLAPLPEQLSAEVGRSHSYSVACPCC